MIFREKIRKEGRKERKGTTKTLLLCLKFTNEETVIEILWL